MSLLSKHYDIGYIGELPLSELPSLISFAERKETEESMRKLYIVHFLLAKIRGNDPVDYEAFERQVFDGENLTGAVRDYSDIDDEISKIEAIYKRGKEA